MNHETRFKKAEEALAAIEKTRRAEADRLDPELGRLVDYARATVKGHQRLMLEPWERACDDVELNVRELVREQGLEAGRVWALALAYKLRAERVAAGIHEHAHHGLTPGQRNGGLSCGIAIGFLKRMEVRTKTA